MDWITDDIAIGNYVEAVNVETLRPFSSVLSLITILAELRRNDKTTELELRGLFDDLDDGAFRSQVGAILAELGRKRVEVVELIDGPGNDARTFKLAVDTLEELTREASPVLVHCHAGRSRSPAVVAGYLMRSLDLTPKQALRRVAARREIFVDQALFYLLENLVHPR